MFVSDPQKEKNEILARLRRVEGQIRGIQRMIEEERDCEAIVTQLMAARAALDRAGLYIMSHHIERCLTTPEVRGSKDRLERIISFFFRLGGTNEFEASAEDLTDVGES
ncbi:MAG: metal-sensitive transcriptional regulator [Chloroflexi bacterium]|nr:metal-sensitive transcriptional regulator [Chloroflexota bacterium]